MDKDLIKRLGEGAFIKGNQLQQFSHTVIPVSPKLNVVLGGGIPGGTITTLAGSPKCGKTVTALHIGAKGQKQGRPLWYINVEGRIKPRDLNGIKDLDQKQMTIVRSYRNDETNESRILTAEEFLEVVEYVCHNIPRSIIIIDSISQLATSGELTKEIGERSYAPGTALLAQLCKKLSNVIPVNDIVLIGIQHVTANFNTLGRRTTITGGNKFKYAADIALECKTFKFLEENGGKIYGQEVTWVTMCTAFAPPGMTTKSIIKYGIGIDELTELAQVGIELGFIYKGGSWFKLIYLLDSMPDKYKGKNNVPNLQGEANLTKFLLENSDEYNALENAISEMFK